ncbi:hypothetical protein OAE72_00650 [Akkermansiaceae bacterium]|nr:hypothetical protein [Akkermansiaceae bacterium]
MAQQLQSVSIVAPAFSGINNQDSPTAIDTSFAATANNCVIDKFGRIGSRKGSVLLTENYLSDAPPSGYLYTNPVEFIDEFVDNQGVSTIFFAGGEGGGVGSNFRYIFKNPENPESVRPSGYEPSANNWKMASLANKAYFFQRGHEPLIYNGGDDLEVLNGSQHSNGTAPQANEIIAAYGKLWAADIEGNKHTVYWSDTLLGGHWNGGTSGSLDLRTVFPSGFDEVTALAAHNGFLIIFCKDCILIYSGAESPASMVLQDVIEGVGCIARDSVQNTGSDIIFLSKDGVRTLGRVIQEKSAPMRDISKNIRDELILEIGRHSGPIKSVYSPEEAFYVLSLPDENLAYCFDMRSFLPDGSARVTTWSDINAKCFLRRRDGDILFGKLFGVYKYTGYNDASRASGGTAGSPAALERGTYTMKYESNSMDFGKPANIKFLKQLEVSVAGNLGEDSVLRWYYDYDPNTEGNFAVVSPALQPNEGEFSAVQGQAGYSGTEFTAPLGQTGYVGTEYASGVYIQTPHANGTGNGRVLTMGLNATIDGSPYSIQRIDLKVLLGRTL